MTTAGAYLRRSWRQCAVVAVFLAMITVGYLTMSVATSCPAQAQVCSCGICVMQGPTSVSGLFATVSAQTAAQIGTATGLINAQYALAAEAFALQATIRFGQIVMDIDDWFDTFWYYNEKPSMQGMTEQDNVMASMQAAAMSTFRDGAEVLRTNHLMGELEFESERNAIPSTQVCMAATAVGGIGRANTITDAYARAAPADAAPRSGGSRGTSGERGTAADIRERHETVRALYCDPAENNGVNTCQSSGALVNADIDVAATVFSNDTINLPDDQRKAATDALVANIAEPFITNNVNPTELNTARGIQQMIARDEMRAKRQTIHTALQYVIARRAPSGSNGAFIAAIRDSAGIPPDLLSDNPSYNEIMEAMLSERFRTGRYSIEQIDTPSNAERELTVQNAFQVMQMHDHLELMDRYALMLAAEVGLEATELRNDRGRQTGRGR